MRKVSIDRLVPGMILARAMYGGRGEMLLAAGIELTPVIIQSLRARGYGSVLVADELSEGMQLNELVSERVRSAGVERLHDTYERLTAATATLRGASSRNVSEGIQSVEMRRALRRHKIAESLWRTVDAIVRDVVALQDTAGLSVLRQCGESAVAHSVDMAAMAVLIGKLAGLDERSLAQVALGALMHEVGNVFIDDAVLNKTGPHTEAEREQLRQHPLWGYELMKAEDWGDILSRHVVYQHHERQDGSGYPRGLAGSNRLGREVHEQFHGGRILLLAEVASLADVYDALSGDHPARPAPAHDQVVATLRDLAGAHLNAALVDSFLNVTPVHPPGTEVRITSGELAGCTALVLRVEGDDVVRPIIRVFTDPQQQLVRPYDIDLRQEPEIDVAGASDAVVAGSPGVTCAA